MTPFDLILHFSLELTAVRLRAKFELASTVREILGGSKNFKSGSCDHMTPFDLILRFSR